MAEKRTLEQQRSEAREAFGIANTQMENALHSAANVNVVGDLILRIPLEEEKLRERLIDMRDRRAVAAAKRLLAVDKVYAAAQKRCEKLGIW